jgi:RNA polymerase sigma factor (sigma-70 family)
VIDQVEIHRGIQAHEQEAVSELALFLRHRNIREYMHTLGPLAEDYLQQLVIEVMEAIWQNKVEHPDKLIAFCETAAANVRNNGLRIAARAARKLVSIDVISINEGRSHQSPENIENDLIAQDEEARQASTVLRLMERLDPVSREVVRLYYFEERSAEEIEPQLGLTHSEFQRRKDYAVRKLQRDYRALGGGWELLRGGKQPGGFKAALPVAA